VSEGTNPRETLDVLKNVPGMATSPREGGNPPTRIPPEGDKATRDRGETV
jgi:hypothetical protein